MIGKFSLVAFSIFFIFSFAGKKFGQLDISSGDEYTVNTVVSNVIRTKVMAQNMVFTTDLDGTYIVAVDGVNKNGAIVSGKLTHVVSGATAMGKKIKYDSDDREKDNPEAKELRGIMNMPLTVVLDKNGHLKRTSKPLFNTSETLNRLMRYGLNGGPEGIFFTLPIRLQTGGTFRLVKNNDALGTITKTTYTLKSREGDNAILTFEGDFVNTNCENKFGIDVNSDLRGTISGQLTVNAKTGVVSSINSRYDLTGVSSLTGQDLNVKITYNTRTTVVRN